MSRQAIIAVTIGAIILLGAGAAFLYSQTKSTPTTSENTNAEIKMEKETEDERSDIMSGIADIFSSGENVKCTFSSETEDESNSGTIYVSDNNARGDFESTVDNKTTSTYMIRKGETFYMWGDSLPTGIKIVMSLDELSNQLEDPSEESNFSKIVPNTQIDYKCSSWNVDSKLFEEPSNVKFMPIGGIMGMDGDDIKDDSEKTETGSTPQISCNICESLTSDAKNLCLQNCQ